MVPAARTWRRATAAVAGSLIVVSAVLTGCPLAGGSPGAAHRPPASTPTTTTTTEAPLPVTPISWSPCDDGLQCGYVTVPVNYADPGGATIHIALARRPASDPAARLGSIVINPGGPGASGIDDLPTELRVLTPGLLARFDIVSFDPRGVGRSAPVSCEQGPTGTAGGNVPAQLPDPTPTDAGSAAALLENDQTYAAACVKATGALLGFVGTTDAAMDLDRIRAALGDDKLTYIGHSYGTLLGETYADMFPTRIRAMVLDSVIDPSISMVQMVSDQAVGFETVLDDFFTWCAGTSECAWRPTEAPQAALLALIATSRAHMLPGYDGRGAGPGEFYDALLDTLYAVSSWPALGNALAAAQAGNGAPVLSLSDSYTEHGVTNLSDANTAITCLDHPSPSDPSAYPALAAAAAARAPVFGPLLTWGILGCGVWLEPATRLPHVIDAAGSPPILVVGTTKDPATPYAWAVHVAAMLQNGVLLTRVGEDHIAYFYSACVRSYVESYLIAGSTPPEGTVCQS